MNHLKVLQEDWSKKEKEYDEINANNKEAQEEEELSCTELERMGGARMKALVQNNQEEEFVVTEKDILLNALTEQKNKLKKMEEEMLLLERNNNNNKTSNTEEKEKTLLLLLLQKKEFIPQEKEKLLNAENFIKKAQNILFNNTMENNNNNNEMNGQQTSSTTNSYNCMIPDEIVTTVTTGNTTTSSSITNNGNNNNNNIIISPVLTEINSDTTSDTNNGLDNNSIVEDLHVRNMKGTTNDTDDLFLTTNSDDDDNNNNNNNNDDDDDDKKPKARVLYNSNNNNNDDATDDNCYFEDELINNNQEFGHNEDGEELNNNHNNNNNNRVSSPATITVASSANNNNNNNNQHYNNNNNSNTVFDDDDDDDDVDTGTLITINDECKLYSIVENGFFTFFYVNKNNERIGRECNIALNNIKYNVEYFISNLRERLLLSPPSVITTTKVTTSSTTEGTAPTEEAMEEDADPTSSSKENDSDTGCVRNDDTEIDKVSEDVMDEGEEDNYNEDKGQDDDKVLDMEEDDVMEQKSRQQDTNIQEQDSHQQNHQQKVHKNQEQSTREQDLLVVDKENEGKHYNYEEILDERINKKTKQIELLVRWVGKWKNTWEPISNFTDIDNELDELRRSKKEIQQQQETGNKKKATTVTTKTCTTTKTKKCITTKKKQQKVIKNSKIKSRKRKGENDVNGKTTKKQKLDTKVNTTKKTLVKNYFKEKQTLTKKLLIKKKITKSTSTTVKKNTGKNNISTTEVKKNKTTTLQKGKNVSTSVVKKQKEIVTVVAPIMFASNFGINYMQFKPPKRSFACHYFGSDRLQIVAADLKPKSPFKPTRNIQIGNDMFEMLCGHLPSKSKGSSNFNHGPPDNDDLIEYTYVKKGKKSLQEELEEIADFSALPPEKAKSRLELLVSGTNGGVILDTLDASNFVDVEENFHQGCAFYPEELRYVFDGGPSKRRNLSHFFVVRVFIPSYGIYKGLFCPKPGIDRVELPSSMRKVPRSKKIKEHGGGATKSNAFVIVKNKFPTENNYQLSQMLKGLRYNKKDFGGYKKGGVHRSEPGDMIYRVWQSIGVPIPVWKNYRNRCITNEKNIKHSYFVGVRDPFFTLPAGTIFVTGLAEHIESSLNNRVFITRSPCNEASDGRLMRIIVEKPKKVKKVHWDWLNSLPFGAVVFGPPYPGSEPLPTQIAGGDLDGDNYFICWDAHIVNHIKTVDISSIPESLCYVEKEKCSNAGPKHWLSTAQYKMLDTEATYSINRLIGKFWSLNEKTADEKKKFMKDPTAIQWARMYKEALDMKKHGGILVVPASMGELIPKEFLAVVKMVDDNNLKKRNKKLLKN